MEQTKQVNGLELVLYNPEKMYGLPTEDSSPVKFLWDETRSIFLPVSNQNKVFSVERYAEAPDGSKMLERIIYREPSEVTDAELADVARLVQLRKMQAMADFWLGLKSFRGLIMLAGAVCLGVFLWGFVGEIAASAAGVAARVAVGMATAGYYVGLVISALIGVFFLRMMVPVVFGTSFSSSSYTAEAGESGDVPNAGDININIQQGVGGGGYQARDHAQRMVNNRDL